MDSHAWSEAYFPGYGWVEFEPTPGFILPATATAAEDIAALGGGDFLEDEEDEEDLLDFPAGNFGVGEQGGSILDNSAALGALGALLALVLGAAGAWYVYWRILVRTPGPFGAFEGMCRLAALAGVGPDGSHTPREFCSHLATQFPVVGADVLVLGDVYSRVRYGIQKELEPTGQETVRERPDVQTEPGAWDERPHPAPFDAAQDRQKKRPLRQPEPFLLPKRAVGQ
jgi:hypothetical protein